MDVKNDNYNMFDLIAYRVKFAQHPRAGATWYMFLTLAVGFETQRPYTDNAAHWWHATAAEVTVV